MPRARRIAAWSAGVVVGLLLLVVGAVYALTNTDWGREQVRGRLVSLLNGSIHGRVTLGRLTGNLLTGATMEGISITDSAGIPFLRADTVQARYTVRGLLSKRLYFDNVRLVRPLLVFDKPPGGRWNTSRLFGDTATNKPPSAPSWGSWFALTDVTVVDGRVIARAPWTPSDTLRTEARRDSAIRAALAGETRYNVVRYAGGGFQKITDLTALNGRLPLVRINDPEQKFMRVDVATLRANAQAFTGEPARIRDLVGRFDFNGDSAWFRDVQAAFPGSTVKGGGHYDANTNALQLQVHSDQASFADFRWAYPPFPDSGGGRLDLAMDWPGDRGGDDRYDVTNADIAVGRSRAAGDLRFAIGDTVWFAPSSLRFETFDSGLIEQLVPTLELPRRGDLTGRLAMEGGFRAMHVDGDVTFDDRTAGRSRLVARGEVGYDTTMFRARDLDLRFLPLQVAMARSYMPKLPVGGTVSGDVHLDGDTRATLTFRADLAHDDRGAHSAVTGNGLVRPAPSAAATYVDASLRLHPLALATPGRFAPAVGLRGTASGPVRVVGTTRDLRLTSDLLTSDGGRFAAQGRANIAARVPTYDVGVNTRLFNANAVVAKAPRTLVTGAFRARGRGFDPATMQLDAAANVAAGFYDSLRVDSVAARVHVADGLAEIPELGVRLPGGSADVHGSFGLRGDRQGQLSYIVHVDSLATFARYLPRDTGRVAPSPARVREAVLRARADSARLAQATELQRAISGGRSPRLVVDTPSTIRKDSLAGAVYLAGRLAGNVKRFDARGRIGVERLAALGNTVASGRAEFAVVNGRMSSLDSTTKLVLAAELDSITAGGFGLDSAALRLSFQRPGGTALLAVYQAEDREYTADATFTLGPKASSVNFSDLRLRLDTTVYANAGPGSISWGGDGVDVAHIDLRHADAGRLYANGHLLGTRPADLTVAVSGFEIGSVLTLLQSDVDATGVVAVSARLQGTPEAPTLHGALGGAVLHYNRGPLPDLRATFDYAAGRLTTHAEVLRAAGRPGAGKRMMIADATIPANLAFSGPTVERFPNEPLVADVKLDSLSLYSLSAFTDVVADTRGALTGEVHVRGLRTRPSLNGVVSLERGRMRVVPAGITLQDMAAHIRMENDTVVLVDSIVAYSGGRILVNGTVGVGSFREPQVNLVMTARNARAFDNSLGYARADADIQLHDALTELHASGSVRVLNGVLYIPDNGGRNVAVLSGADPTVFAVVDTALPSERALVAEPSAIMRGLAANIAVNISRDTWVRSNEANVEIFSDGDLAIRLDRGDPIPVLDGTVSTERGEYTFATRRFQIRQGTATFTGTEELDPLVQATATIDVPQTGREALVIRLVIGGTLTNPRLSVESDAQPPISQSDLLSYIALGRSSSSLLDIGTSGGTNTAAGTSGAISGATGFVRSRLTSVALGMLLDQARQSTARALKADVLNIQPAPDVPSEIYNVSKFGSLLRATDIEYGRYLSTREFLGLNVRPDPSAPLPGVRYELRGLNGFRLETSLQPRYILADPTLDLTLPARTSVFGAFLIREWRF